MYKSQDYTTLTKGRFYSFGQRAALLCCFLFFYAFIFAQSPVAVNGKLRVEGTQLVNKNGVAVQLRGMSSHGAQWFTEDYNYNSLSVLANTWGIDVFRIAMYPTDEPDQTGNAYQGNPAFWKAYIDNIVDICGKLGIYCMIDWHVLTPGNPNAYADMAKDFWDYMSKKHAGKDHVLYEICNEPNGVDWLTVKSYAETMIKTIRFNDPSTIIIVGSPTWSSDVDIASLNPIKDQTNLMYTFHFYAASHGQNYRDKISTAMKNGLAIFVTEWGSCDASGTGNNNWDETNKWISFMQTNKLSWCNWSYSDKSETAATLTPGAGSAQEWDNVNAQGIELKKLISTPADSWTSSGNWTPSTNISLPLNGSYFLPNKAISIKAEANDKGGSIASVALLVDGAVVASDASAPFEFSWTPATAKDYIVSTKVTDNAGATAVSIPFTYKVVSVLPAQTPYGGTAFALPATIGGISAPLSSINFDNGGELIAYHDLDGVHKGPKTGNARQTEGVDVEGSNNIGYVLTGEWLEYTVNNPAGDGLFDVSLSYTTPLAGGGAFHFECNESSTAKVLAPPTGGWSSYQSLTAKDLLIPAGTQVVRLYIDRGNINLSNITFKRTSSTGKTYTIAVTSGTGGTVDPNGNVTVGEGLSASFNISPSPGYSISEIKLDNIAQSIANPFKIDNVKANHTLAVSFSGNPLKNIAINGTATASSIESSQYPAQNAIDGNPNTRWSSQFADPQWIKVAFDKVYTLEGFAINWETAASKDYTIEYSMDDINFTKLVTKTNMPTAPRTDNISITKVSAKYVRLSSTARTTSWGVSIFEFEIYGSSSDNVAPVANAGADQSVADADKNGSEEISLNGSLSYDPDGSIVSYEWKNANNLVIGTTAAIKVTVATKTTQVFTLTVTDNKGKTNSDAVSVTVTEVGNILPVANAGADQTLTDVDKNGSEPVTLKGTASDADGFIVSRAWKDATGKIIDTTATLQRTLAVGTYTFTFEVKDNAGAVASDYVTIIIKAGGCDLLSYFGVPSNAALQSLDNKTFDHAYVLGTGGPNLASVTKFSINWNLQYNGLWVFAFNFNVDPWWKSFLNNMTHTFNSSSPACKITGSGIAGFDGDYWAKTDGSSYFVLVAKSGTYAIYFTNATTAPVVCGSTLKGAFITTEIANSDNEAVSFYPTVLSQGEYLNIRSTASSDNASIAIYDMNGRLVKQSKLTNSIAIDHNFTKGLYYIKIVSENGVTNGKFVIK